MTQPPEPVRRRLVIYVQGYDPRGLAEYYRMFRREFRNTCALYGLTGTVASPVNDAERFITTWKVATEGPDWQVETTYAFLRWEDIIRQDFARPAWWKIVHMVRVVGTTLFNGAFGRIYQAHWRFGLFVLYPLVLLMLWLMLGAFAGAGVMQIASALGMPNLAAASAGILAGIATFAAAIRFTEKQTYLLYLCDDAVATDQFAHRQRPDWDARMELFAGYVADAVRNSDADEVVIVGHSSGSFLAVDVLDRALTRDSALGQHGPRVRLLTIGANLPIVGFNPGAQWFRDRIQRLALRPDIDWVDYQSRHDIMNFWPFDPLTGHGLDPNALRRNPLVVSISFRDLWKAGHFTRRRWRFFRAHFQFLYANERPGASYDYYLICCGPLDLVSRAGLPGVEPPIPPA